MNLLAAEGIKLMSTRSPRWLAAIATVVALGFAALRATTPGEPALSVTDTQLGAGFGVVFVMILAVTAVSDEYRYRTIGPTLQAVPNRTRAVLAKVGLITLVAAALGLVHGLAGYGLARAVSAVPVAPLDSLDRWREVVGVGAYYAIAATIAIAVAFVVRSAAIAVTGLLLWVFVVETIAPLSETGSRLHNWFPFRALDHVIGQAGGALPYGHWAAVAYSTVLAAVLLLAAILVVEQRDT
ncbi:MAG: hypothetical protein ACT4RN_19110 [Pseudonocardia sp.]